jgi:Tfp pilus assembly protein PilP
VKPATPPPAPGASGAAPATASMPPQTTKTPVESYTYEPENRRDPFISLIGTGADTTVTRKGEGIAGMAIAEISVRGIMQSRGGYVAMVEGADKKTYVVHAGDKFADGTIKTILPTGLVIIQEVNDPLSLVKQREVRKLLRSLEDAK